MSHAEKTTTSTAANSGSSSSSLKRICHHIATRLRTSLCFSQDSPKGQPSRELGMQEHIIASKLLGALDNLLAAGPARVVDDVGDGTTIGAGPGSSPDQRRRMFAQEVARLEAAQAEYLRVAAALSAHLGQDGPFLQLVADMISCDCDAPARKKAQSKKEIKRREKISVTIPPADTAQEGDSTKYEKEQQHQLDCALALHSAYSGQQQRADGTPIGSDPTRDELLHALGHTLTYDLRVLITLLSNRARGMPDWAAETAADKYVRPASAAAAAAAAAAADAAAAPPTVTDPPQHLRALGRAVAKNRGAVELFLLLQETKDRYMQYLYGLYQAVKAAAAREQPAPAPAGDDPDGYAASALALYNLIACMWQPLGPHEALVQRLADVAEKRGRDGLIGLGERNEEGAYQCALGFIEQTRAWGKTATSSIGSRKRSAAE